VTARLIGGSLAVRANKNEFVLGYKGSVVIFRSSGLRAVGTVLAAVALAGCTATGGQLNTTGTAPIEIQPGTRGPVSGVGIEGRDVQSMADQMVRDMMADPEVTRRQTAPRVIVDGEFFRNESAQAINRNIIADRLRIQLSRAARGKMVFLSRENIRRVEQERDLKRSGAVDVGTTGLARAVAGADFQLTGRITSLDSRNPRTGQVQRYTQITFELLDLETSAVVWGNDYTIERAAGDDVVYR
jgi:penicillin-binding protein activator